MYIYLYMNIWCLYMYHVDGSAPKSAATITAVDANHDINPKWPGLTAQILIDIYAVHKALNYGQFQRN